MKLKLEIIKLNLNDVIVTSCAHSSSEHVRILNDDETNFYCAEYKYNDGVFSKPQQYTGPIVPISRGFFVNPQVDVGNRYLIWYYKDSDGTYHICQGDHDFIDDNPENLNYYSQT